MRRYHFIQVDVFTDTPFGGNQLAVFTDARGLSTDEMQTLAREMNYSESVFVLPPEIRGADKRIRIFTPTYEMPMAGHPTVGTTFVLAQRGEITGAEATLQLNLGPTPVSVERNPDGSPRFVWMAHRAPEFGTTRADRDRVAAALGITANDVRDDLPLQIVSTGVPYLYVPLRSLDAIGRCKVNQPALAGLFGAERCAVYLFSTETTSLAASVHARMFTPDDVPEDPATGSAAGPMGAYVARYNVLPRQPHMRFIIEQGVEMGRPSQIHLDVRTEGEAISGIRIGGQSVIVGEGHIFWR
ncbi:MAG: PhzF family phenazine biosynthesis protein [Anaerolineales bacterium]